jgi:hypothetical protein
MIVIGKTRQPWYRRFWVSSILDRLLARSEGLDVMIVDV